GVRAAQGVAGAPDGVDQLQVVPDVDLLAQQADIDVHGVRVRVFVHPDALLDDLAGEDLAFVAGQRLQQLVLAVAQADGHAGPGHTALYGVDLHVSDADDARVAHLVAAQQCPHPRPQLGELERLG